MSKRFQCPDPRDERGSAALPALAMAMLLIACVSAITTIGASRTHLLEDLDRHTKAKALLLSIPVRILELIASDPSPDADSYHDPLWSFDPPKGVKYSISDLSAKLDPENLAKGFIASLCIPIEGREREAASWLNPELADAKRVNEIASLHGRDAIPPFSLEAPLNANSADQAELEAAIASPSLGLVDPRAATRAILQARERSEIGASALSPMLEGNAMALKLIGVRTWFWRVEARLDSLSLEAVITRLPGDLGIIIQRLEVKECEGGD